MKCNQCGCEVRDDAKFCPICGADLSDQKVEAEFVSEETVNVEQPKKQAKCWAAFSKVAKILGILSLIPFVGLYTGEAGIVFGILGMRVIDPELKAQAKSGMIKSIIGLAYNIVLFIIVYVVIILGSLAVSMY